MVHLRTTSTGGLTCFTHTIIETADPLSAGAATRTAPTSPEASAPAEGSEPAVPWDLGARSVLEGLADPAARWACMARSAQGATSGEEGLGALPRPKWPLGPNGPCMPIGPPGPTAPPGPNGPPGPMGPPAPNLPRGPKPPAKSERFSSRRPRSAGPQSR